MERTNKVQMLTYVWDDLCCTEFKMIQTIPLSIQTIPLNSHSCSLFSVNERIYLIKVHFGLFIYSCQIHNSSKRLREIRYTF